MGRLLQSTILSVLIASSYFAVAPEAVAQATLHNETAGIWRAEVIEVTETGERTIPGTDASAGVPL